MHRRDMTAAGTGLMSESESRQAGNHTDDSSLSRGQRRIPSLDGLRGISIWAVILAHSADHFLFSRIHSHHLRTVLSNSANLGVTIFFVISGFLITSLL